MIIEMVVVGLVFFIGLLVGAGLENRDWHEHKVPELYFAWRFDHGLVDEAELDRRCEGE